MGILRVHGGVSQVSNNFPLLGKQLFSWPPPSSSAVILHCHFNGTENNETRSAKCPSSEPHTTSFTGLRRLYQETQWFFAVFPENQHCFDGKCCNLFSLILPNPTSTQHKSLVGFELGWQQALLPFQLTLGDTRFSFFFFFPPPSHFYSIVFFNYTQGSFHHLPHQIFLSKYEWWLNIQKTLCSGHIVISIPCARRKRIKPSLPSHLLNMLCQCKKSILLYKLQEQCIYLPCWNSVAFHWK